MGTVRGVMKTPPNLRKDTKRTTNEAKKALNNGLVLHEAKFYQILAICESNK